MEYNTNRCKLAIPEYGRNIHKMIDFTMQIKNREKRNKCAWAIIKIMTNKKFKKNINIFQHKLWNQLLIMSNYQLDIDVPFFNGKHVKNKKKLYKKISYPKYLTDFRYYGKIIRNMIRAAIRCKNEQKKEGLLYVIANTMKKNYLRWNKNSVKDEVIYKDLKKLSNGKICSEINPLLQYGYNCRKYYKKKKYMKKEYKK